MGDTSEEVRVRDLLRSGELTPRPVLGFLTSERVGARFWERPNVAISGRLYRKYGVEDPWDPDCKNKGREIGLGPVGLRLTEPRRQVAPHLRPKAPKQKKKPQAIDPLARWRKKEAAKPSPRAAPAPPPRPEPPRMFEGPKRHPLKGKLPVRPDIEDPRAGDRPPTPSPPGPSRSSSGRIRVRGRQVMSEAPRVITSEDSGSEDS